jgi:hypothetical protein
MNTIAKETQTIKQFEQLRTGGPVGHRAESLGGSAIVAFAIGPIPRRSGTTRSPR